jgi:hypothetical protein
MTMNELGRKVLRLILGVEKKLLNVLCRWRGKSQNQGLESYQIRERTVKAFIYIDMQNKDRNIICYYLRLQVHY